MKTFYLIIIVLGVVIHIAIVLGDKECRAKGGMYMQTGSGYQCLNIKEVK